MRFSQGTMLTQTNQTNNVKPVASSPVSFNTQASSAKPATVTPAVSRPVAQKAPVESATTAQPRVATKVQSSTPVVSTTNAGATAEKTNVSTVKVNSENVQASQNANVQNSQHTDTSNIKNAQPQTSVERFNTTASKVAGQQQNSKQNNVANTGNSYAVKPNNLANSNQLSIQGAYCNALNTINVALNHQMSGDLKSQIQFSNGGGIKSVTQNGNMLTITTNQDMDFQNKMEIRIPSQNIVYDVREEIGKDMGVVRTAAFDNKYTYNGNDLGVTYTPTQSTFKIWAPTASAIEVNTYENDTDPNSKAKNHYSMKYVGQGVWEVTVQGDLNNTAYDYTIHFADGATNETYDPYATACVEGGYRSVVLAPSETGANVSSIGKDDPTNEVIGEIHIRDFTNNPSSGVPAKLRGTYLGAVYQGSKNASSQATGLDYLKQQGINTVQIQPAFQYDDGSGKTYQYNWGYNPENYNIPEGWYSTNRDDPATRIKEFKEMVQAFHNNGIRVNMDVVYNHVGNYGKNALALSVPGYYFSYDGNGNLTNASACGNDVASERNMVRNYIVHSVKYWHDVYGVDGFRFDLMGNLDVKTMNAIRAALPNCVLYGEGWNMGANIPANTRADQANENQMPTIGTFNGWGRTIIRGSDDGKQHGYITGNDSQVTMSSLANFIYGSQNAKNTPSDAYDSGVNYVNPGQLINYTECHDNKTLWDTIVAAYPNESADLTMRRAELGNAITILNQGVPYLQVGQGFGRSKDGNGNSYNAGDAINNINWNRENQFPWAVSYEKALLQLRAADPGFRMTSFSDIDKNFKWVEIGNNGVIGYQLTSPATGRTYIVAFSNNGSTQQLTGLQNGKYKVLIKNCNGYVTDPQELTVTNGSTDIPSLSCLVLEVDNAAAQKPLISNNSNNQQPTNKPASGTNTKPAGTTTNKPVSGNSNNSKPATTGSNSNNGTNKPATSSTGSSSNKPNTNGSSSTSSNNNSKPATTGNSSSSQTSGTANSGTNSQPANSGSGSRGTNISGNNSNTNSANGSASNSTSSSTSAQGSTTAPASQSKPANSSNASAGTSANGENGSSAMAGGNSTTPGKTASDVNNGSSNKGGQSQAQSQNGSKTTVSDNGNVKTESSSNSGTADSIAALEKKTGLPAAEIKKMLAIAEANGGKAQFQNEQQHVYHVGSQGQMVAEPAGSAVSAPVEEAAPAQSASAPVETASAASATSGSASSSAANSSNASNSNALPETGMANEGIEFAAAMLAMAGIAMVKRNHEE